MADGCKLDPFVVFKGVRPLPELIRIPGVVVSLSRNGWMNEALTKEWIDRVWVLKSHNSEPDLLVWDAYRCHMMDSIRGHIDKYATTNVSIIPGGLTSIV